MKTKIFLFAALAFVVISFNSCKKFPDGPAFSLRSANGRLAHQWQPSKVTVDGVDNTANWAAFGYKITFSKGGAYTESFTFFGSTISVAGTWKWTNGNKSIEKTSPATANNVAYTETWEVQRLTAKELNVMQTDITGGSSHVYVYNFTRAD